MGDTAKTATHKTLDRYVPRVATDWDVDAPDSSWQELDATLCFVDISGFTNLSEKLARRGRIGAEELTGVLNYVFGKMLELAYQQGGSLLKFGGDALLLMYRGHDHASRAASAAVEMRTALKGAADYETSVGKLRLRMSVGIHSGPIHLFRVGTSHNELVIAGPGGTTTTVMEKIADPGQIVVSDGTKALLPDDAVGGRKDGGWILKWRKAHCSAPGPVSRKDRDPDELSEWIPQGLRDYLGAGEAEPEHRIASVGFVRYCGVDDAMATKGPDWVAAAIAETMAAIQNAADEEGITFLATDINEDGGKAILVAGAPVALEEDEARLLRAVRTIADAGTPLDVHVGVNRGHVFTGEVGTEFRSTYTVMGDTVNLSARLMAVAPAGSIYATPALLDQSGTLFATDALEPFYVKGKDEPVRAFTVGDAIGERTGEDRTVLRFVGRADESARIQAGIDAVIHLSGSTITVIGDAGLGKSRLVSEVTRANPDVTVMAIRTEPYGSATPYRPLRDRIRELLGIERAANGEMAIALAAKVADVAPDLVPMIPLIAHVAHIDVPETPEVADIGHQFRQDRLATVVASLMTRLMTEPTVVVVEDAQWMDEASTYLLSHLVTTSSERPWLLLVTRRGHDSGFVPDGGDTIEMPELSPAEAERLVLDATRSTPLHPQEVSAVVARTGGNPLFIAEVLRIVAETGSTDQLPDSLGTLVSTSIDALPTLTRRMLRYASVLGRSFRISTAAEILAEDDLELDAGTRELLGDFLEPSGPGRLRFRTPMVRDVAYDGLSFRRREELHRRAAEAIAKTTGGSPEEAADQLAMHYFLGNDHANTWHFARIAADRATRAFATAEAATQLERALASGKKLPDLDPAELVATWTQLGDVKERAGMFDDALDAYAKGSRLVSEDPETSAELLLRKAWVRERSGHYPTALRDATNAKRVIEAAPRDIATGVVARATAFQALVRLRQGKLTDAYKTAETARGLAGEVGNTAALARAFSVMAWTRVMTGDPQALELCEQTLEMYQELGDLPGQNKMNNNLGFLAYFDNRWDDAVAFYESSRTGAERVGDVVDVASIGVNLGELLVNQRRFDEAEVLLTDSIRVLRATGSASMATFAEMLLARILIERGETEAAEAKLAAIAEESAHIGFTSVTAEARLHIADCSLRGGEPSIALTQIEYAITEAGEEAAEFEFLEARLRACCLHELGDTEAALAVTDRALDSAATKDLQYDTAMVLGSKATILVASQPVAAAECSAQAEEIRSRLGIR